MATTATTTIEAGKAPRLAQHTKWRNQSRRGKGKQGNEQLYMQHNGQDIIKPRFVECVWQCVGGVSKFLIVDAFAAGRTKIYEVRV